MTHAKINKNYLIILLGILAAIGPFTIDMYLPGFQRIAQDLYTDEQHVAFTLTSYFVGIALGQLFYGPIVDKYGRKKPLLFGLGIYILAAIGCALSPMIEVMIGMRFLQALGGCVGMVASTAIISDVYEVQYRARAFSSIMLVMGVAPLIAPSVGSFFVEKWDWEFIFYFLAVFAGIVFLLIQFLLPETSRYMHSNKLKIREIVAGYLEVLKNKTFLFYTLAGSIAMSVMFAYISSASFIFISFYGLDKATFSLLFAVNASGIISGSYLNGLLTRKVNYIKISNYAALILSLISLCILIFVLINPHLPYQWLVVTLFLILFTIGFINPNATAASLAPFTKNSGTASALGGAIRMGTGALVATAVGLFQGESSLTMFIMIFVLSILAASFLWIMPMVKKIRS
ncbi:MAG: multidrug effflux MFS transporter [Flavobacteriaceae bacterium]|jgi:DHA1 family bicyclomycin/chloramphenicol resistance-like MFS transporter|nr:multidrug effflux MFS transporter [Flavobacteriaceae bacterium]